MKLSFGTAMLVLGCCMFCGIIIIAIGLGAAFPVIDNVAAPFVCGGKALQPDQQSYSYRPGEVTTTVEWYCTDDKTGQQQSVDLQIILTAGSIYGLLLFAIFLAWWFIANRPGSATAGDVAAASPVAHPPHRASSSESAMQRLAELKRMYDANLITQPEYEKKKAEILENL